jgi:REP element-mobilizing transposase RayT
VQDINLASILAHIPPPNPTSNPAETSEWTSSKEDSFLFPWEHGNPPVEQAGSTQPVKTRQPSRSVEDTAPHPGTGIQAAQTAYTCVLLPRLPQHKLNGTLSQLISDGLPELCLSYGWRLECSDLQPDYLQWTLRVAPAVSPGNTVRILRRALSERIFELHPELRPLDLREDFWAAGYLILSGSAAPAPAALQDFILKTRRRQGYTQP